MNLSPLILIAILLLLVFSFHFGFRKVPSSGARILVGSIGVLFLFAVTTASAFGFVATYELHNQTARLPWQMGYGELGGIALLALARAFSGAGRHRRF